MVSWIEMVYLECLGRALRFKALYASWCSCCVDHATAVRKLELTYHIPSEQISGWIGCLGNVVKHSYGVLL